MSRVLTASLSLLLGTMSTAQERVDVLRVVGNPVVIGGSPSAAFTVRGPGLLPQFDTLEVSAVDSAGVEVPVRWSGPVTTVPEHWITQFELDTRNVAAGETVTVSIEVPWAPAREEFSLSVVAPLELVTPFVPRVSDIEVAPLPDTLELDVPDPPPPTRTWRWEVRRESGEAIEEVEVLLAPRFESMASFRFPCSPGIESGWYCEPFAAWSEEPWQPHRVTLPLELRSIDEHHVFSVWVRAEGCAWNHQRFIDEDEECIATTLSPGGTLEIQGEDLRVERLCPGTVWSWSAASREFPGPGRRRLEGLAPGWYRVSRFAQDGLRDQRFVFVGAGSSVSVALTEGAPARAVTLHFPDLESCFAGGEAELRVFTEELKSRSPEDPPWPPFVRVGTDTPCEVKVTACDLQWIGGELRPAGTAEDDDSVPRVGFGLTVDRDQDRAEYRIGALRPRRVRWEAADAPEGFVWWSEDGMRMLVRPPFEVVAPGVAEVELPTSAGLLYAAWNDARATVLLPEWTGQDSSAEAPPTLALTQLTFEFAEPSPNSDELWTWVLLVWDSQGNQVPSLLSRGFSNSWKSLLPGAGTYHWSLVQYFGRTVLEGDVTVETGESVAVPVELPEGPQRD